ncbi:MAG TPA: DUF4157 domain-containing protein [Nocardioides sp.]|uniref:eCIS core domain-containing protein n=1 Tax=Nocardioides sp. TaxID=35761 RepID=UPI002BE2B0C7|nr:DUF4157 domain-containing protein [Nocardioides sp.]HTW14904.1 DUF4157 domain-containing protein [Nocardioides sp.]
MTPDADRILEEPADGIRRAAGHADRLGGSAAPPDLLRRLAERRGRGDALPGEVTHAAGSELGCDLSEVRIHRDHEANRIARSVDARAFSHGTDLYFSAGAFDLSDDRGRHLLAHELAHVADRQPSGDPGLIGRADDPAERRADESADRVLPTLRRAMSAPDSPAAEANPGDPPGVAAAGTLRRKVGFEFETPWEIKGPSNTIGSDTDAFVGQRGPTAEEINALAEDERPSMQDLWHVSPDMKPPTMTVQGPHGPIQVMRPEFLPTKKTVPKGGIESLWGATEEVITLPKYSGYGNLEFITAAFEETPQGLVHLTKTITQIVEVVDYLSSKPAGETTVAELIDNVIPLEWGKHLRLKENLEKRKDVVIDTRPWPPGGAPLYAAIQLTGGIKLEQIPALFERMSQPVPHNGGDLLHSSRGGDRQATRTEATRRATKEVLDQADADSYYAKSARPEQAAYEGAVLHLADIIRRGATIGTGTDKTKYVTPLMSRTNFGLLPFAIRSAPEFAQHVYDASEVQPAAKLFGANGNTHLWQGTVQTWVESIQAGNDPVNWGQDKPERWAPQNVGEPDDQSIGHVYEFRGLNAQLPVTDWMTEALRLFAAVQAINSAPL